MLTCNPRTWKLGVGSYPNIIKDISQHHSNEEWGAGIISSKEQEKDVCPSCPHIDDLGRAVRIEKEIKGIQIEKVKPGGVPACRYYYSIPFQGKVDAAVLTRK